MSYLLIIGCQHQAASCCCDVTITCGRGACDKYVACFCDPGTRLRLVGIIQTNMGDTHHQKFEQVTMLINMSMNSSLSCTSKCSMPHRVILTSNYGVSHGGFGGFHTICATCGDMLGSAWPPSSFFLRGRLTGGPPVSALGRGPGFFLIDPSRL